MRPDSSRRGQTNLQHIILVVVATDLRHKPLLFLIGTGTNVFETGDVRSLVATRHKSRQVRPKVNKKNNSKASAATYDYCSIPRRPYCAIQAFANACHSVANSAVWTIAVRIGSTSATNITATAARIRIHWIPLHDIGRVAAHLGGLEAWTAVAVAATRCAD